MLKTLLSLLLCIGAISLYAQTTYLHCGRLIDCTSNNVQTEMTVIIEDGKIKSVEKGYQNPAEGKAIDLKDKTVMPGLMDMHVHIEGESNPRRYIERFTLNDADVALRSTIYAERTLMAGFTTVRDLGGTGVNVSLRNAIDQGFVKGPRIVTAEKAIGTTGGHADPSNGVRKELKGDPGPADGVVNSPEDARKAVRQRYKNGADCIKITATGGVLSVAKDGQGPQFQMDELKAIVSTANDYGMHSAAHAHGAEGMKRAVLAGISSIEHGTFMTEEIINLMVKHGTYYVPTISAGKFVVEKAKQPGYFPAIIVPKALSVGPQIQETFAKAYRGGVKIAFGTDSGVSPHGDNGKEFLFMVEAGMKPMEAILSATINAADLIRRPDLGMIAAGKMADIIAVDGKPEENIEDILNVTFVMKNGEIYKNE
jgi:imidazolonepropionase-like amidohydrolase